MNRRWLVSILIVMTVACDKDLKAPMKAQSPRPPGHATVIVSRAGVPISTTQYSNDSASNYFYCKRDRNGKFYVDGRRFIEKQSGQEDRLVTFFFPDPTVSDHVNSEWTEGAVALYGKLPPYSSLGGSLQGTCKANLKFNVSASILSGDISCQNFVNNDSGIGVFDFSLINLNCVVQ